MARRGIPAHGGNAASHGHRLAGPVFFLKKKTHRPETVGRRTRRETRQLAMRPSIVTGVFVSTIMAEGIVGTLVGRNARVGVIAIDGGSASVAGMVAVGAVFGFLLDG